MEKQRSRRVLLGALLVTATLLGPSHGLAACSVIQNVGTAFSVTSWSCLNYSAEFSWNLDLLVADTRVQLTCWNQTHEYAPDIPVAFRTSLSLNHPLPLTGEVECEVAGCYEDRDTFARLLIPPSNFSCPPPPTPSSMAPSSVAVPGTPPATSPSPSLSPPKPPPVSCSPSPGHTTSEVPQPSSSPSVTRNREEVPQPSSSPSVTRNREGSRQLEVVIIAVPLSSLIGVVVLLCLFLFCAFDGYRRFCGDSGKYVINMHQDDQVDPDFSLKLADYNMCRSTDTIIELPVWKSTPTLDETTSLSDSLAGGEMDNVSTTSSQHPFPSCCSEQLATNTLLTHPTQDATQVARDVEPGVVKFEYGVRNDSTTSAHTVATSTYVCESELTTTSGAASTASCGTSHWANYNCSNSARFPSIPCLVESDQEAERDKVEPPGVATCSRSREMNLPLREVTIRSPPPEDFTGDEVRVQTESGSRRLGEKLTAPQLTTCDEPLGPSVGDEDEVAMSFVEKFTHTGDLPSTSSSGTSSGLSTGSYLQWPTAEH